MKLKTSELTGLALNWVVAQAQGMHVEFNKYFQDAVEIIVPEDDIEYDNDGYPISQIYSPSTAWSDGGWIIEREGLLVRPSFTDERDKWTSIQWAPKAVFESGPTPLIAAMRCYVASKFGDEVDVPLPEEE